MRKFIHALLQYYNQTISNKLSSDQIKSNDSIYLNWNIQSI
jgi:hypothetical protein